MVVNHPSPACRNALLAAATHHTNIVPWVEVGASLLHHNLAWECQLPI